jgi:hypothetical protein
MIAVIFFMKAKAQRSSRPDRDLYIWPVYREDQYPDLLLLSEDPDTLPPTWRGFKTVLDTEMEAADREGSDVYLVNVNLYDIVAYCAERQVRMNTAQRAEYAVFQATKEDSDVRRRCFDTFEIGSPGRLRRIINEVANEIRGSDQRELSQAV